MVQSGSIDEQSLVKKESGGSIQSLGLAEMVETPRSETVQVWLSKLAKQIYTADKGESWKAFGAGSQVLLNESGIHVEQLRTVEVDGVEKSAPYVERNERGQEVAFHFRLLAIGFNQQGRLIFSQFPVTYKLSGYVSENVTNYLYEVTAWETKKRGDGSEYKVPIKSLCKDRGYICDVEDVPHFKDVIRKAGGAPIRLDLSAGLTAILDSTHNKFEEFYSKIIGIDKFSHSNFETKSRRRVCEQLLGASAVPVEIKHDNGDVWALFEVKRFSIPPIARIMIEQLGKAMAQGERKLADELIGKITSTVRLGDDRPSVIEEMVQPQLVVDAAEEEHVEKDTAEEPHIEEGVYEDVSPEGEDLFQAEPPLPTLAELPEPKFNNKTPDVFLYLYRCYIGHSESFKDTLKEGIGILDVIPENLQQDSFKAWIEARSDKKLIQTMLKLLGYYDKGAGDES